VHLADFQRQDFIRLCERLRSRWNVPFRPTMLVAAFPLATALSYAAPFRAPPLLRAPARAAVLMQSVTPADQSPVEQFTGLVRGDLSFQAVRTGADVDTPGLAICSPDDCTTVVPAEVVHTAKVGSYFGLWFALSIGYAVCNKRVTNALPLPWCVAANVNPNSNPKAKPNL